MECLPRYSNSRLLFGLLVIVSWVVVMIRPAFLDSLASNMSDSLRREDGLGVVIVEQLHVALETLGVPPPYPNAEQYALILAGALSTALAYFLIFGKEHRDRRIRLSMKLESARRAIREMEAELREAETSRIKAKAGNRPIRIFMEGAFDLMHYDKVSNPIRKKERKKENNILVIAHR